MPPKGSKRTHGESSYLDHDENPNKRTTRSTSRAHADAARDDGNKDTAATPGPPPSLVNLNPEVGQPLQLPLLPPRPVQDAATTEKVARNASNYLNAVDQAKVMLEITADDELADIAYQRRQLIQFIIHPPAKKDPLEIEAPEFASVGYLKRRILKSKFLNGEFIDLNRVGLRARPNQGIGLGRQLPETTPFKTPSLLFNLGFRPGRIYELELFPIINSLARAQKEKANQDGILRAVAGEQPTTAIPINPHTIALQDLYKNTGENQTASKQHQREVVTLSLPWSAAVLTDQNVPTDKSPAVQPAVRPDIPIITSQQILPFEENAADHLLSTSPPNYQGSFAAPVAKAQPVGAWSSAEIECLIRGVFKLSKRWSEIFQEYSGKGIDARRTQVNYKDKWRNITRAFVERKAMRRVEFDDNVKRMLMAILEREEKNNQINESK